MKPIRILLILVLAVSLLTACACDGGDRSETTSEDTTVLTTETPTEEPTQAPAATVDVTLIVKDQDGTPIAEAVVTILPADEASEEEAATLTADHEGTLAISLTEGEYLIRFDVLPEYVLGIDTHLTVTVGMEPVVLDVIDNTPNGSEDRPFVITEDSITMTVPAGATYHFTLFGANHRTLTVADAEAVVTYRETVYTPDESGMIAIRMTTESLRDPSFFSLTNQGSTDKEMTVTLLSDPGAMDNPITVEALDTAITANVPQDGMVYYRWTVTASGTLTVTSTDTINNISLNNLTTSQVSDFSNGAESVTLTVTEGDVISIVVSVIGGDKQAESNSVTFTLSMVE